MIDITKSYAKYIPTRRIRPSPVEDHELLHPFCGTAQQCDVFHFSSVHFFIVPVHTMPSFADTLPATHFVTTNDAASCFCIHLVADRLLQHRTCRSTGHNTSSTAEGHECRRPPCSRAWMARSRDIGNERTPLSASHLPHQVQT